MEVLWGLFALSALLAVIVGGIAKDKGYSFFEWWIYGTLVWPLAMLHVLFLETKPAAAAAKARRRGLRECPECAEWIKADARRCRFCGAHEQTV